MALLPGIVASCALALIVGATASRAQQSLPELGISASGEFLRIPTDAIEPDEDPAIQPAAGCCLRWGWCCRQNLPTPCSKQVGGHGWYHCCKVSTCTPYRGTR